MFKRLIFLVACFSLLAACTDNEPVVFKKEMPKTDTTEKPELVEKEDDKDRDEFIQFTLPHEEVMVNLEKVPILNAYLEAAQNKQAAIKAMKMRRIKANDDNLYLLEFSFKDNKCSYLLLDQSEDNRAYLVADLARSIQTKLSPDHTKILLQFNRKTSLPVPVTDLVVLDLIKWERISLQNQTNDIRLLNYNWPIITAEWTKNDTITATVPTVAEPTKESLINWQENGSPTTGIELGYKLE